MTEWTADVLRSTDALRARADAWDSLHERSGLAIPTARAHHVALWCDHFAGSENLRAIVVRRGQRMVAALPLVERRFPGMKVARLTGNEWTPTGDLMIDHQVDLDEACDTIVAALQTGDWPLLKFNAVPATAARWQAFWDALERARLNCVRRPQFCVNRVRPGSNWQEYFASRSRAHRRRIRRAMNKATAAGELALVCHDALRPVEVEPLLRQLFEIEGSGWKGREGTAVLSQDGIWKFFCAQAQQLAADGELCLVVLEHAGRPIAFEYGWRAHGVYFSPKVAYDEAYAQYAPGQLLRALWLQRITTETDIQTVDFLGPASPATSSWATDDYPIERLLVGTSGTLGYSLVELYRRAGPLVRTLRRWMGRSSAAAHRQSEFDSLSQEREEALATASAESELPVA